jgi:hypothetical protein
MAGVAGGCPVYVPPAYAWVRHARLVCGRLRMAIDARKYQVVRRIQVAVRTHRTVVRNPEVSMVKYRSQPGSGHVRSVAGRAGRRV